MSGLRIIWHQEIEKRKRRPSSIESMGSIGGAESPEDDILSVEGKVNFYKKMQKLNDTTREVMYLRLSGELSFREIGEVLGKKLIEEHLETCESCRDSYHSKLQPAEQEIFLAGEENRSKSSVLRLSFQ